MFEGYMVVLLIVTSLHSYGVGSVFFERFGQLSVLLAYIGVMGRQRIEREERALSAPPSRTEVPAGIALRRRIPPWDAGSATPAAAR
jgi:hypothetical protein